MQFTLKVDLMTSHTPLSVGALTTPKETGHHDSSMIGLHGKEGGEGRKPSRLAHGEDRLKFQPQDSHGRRKQIPKLSSDLHTCGLCPCIHTQYKHNLKTVPAILK